MTNRKFQGYQGFESGTTRGLAPLTLVAAHQRREEPTLELPRLELPLPLPRDADYMNRRSCDTEREPAAPTRGVNVFDMV